MKDLLEIFKRATDALDDRQIDYVVFGGIAVWAYGRRRPTHDIDLMICQHDALATLEALRSADFSTDETDHRWIYKAALDEAQIDLIFKAKGGMKLTHEILERQRSFKIDDFVFRIIDPENLVVLKIMASKETRPRDWYDALSVLENTEDFDWDYLIKQAPKDVLKFLSFLFFAQAMHMENTGQQLVPSNIIDSLYDDYRRGQASSKVA